MFKDSVEDFSWCPFYLYLWKQELLRVKLRQDRYLGAYLHSEMIRIEYLSLFIWRKFSENQSNLLKEIEVLI